METDGENVIQKISFSIMDGNVTMVYEENPLCAYPVECTDGQIPFYGYQEIPERGNNFEPVYVDADTFLDCWKRDMKSVPEGWYHFTNREGLEVFVDNATGSGRMSAFHELEDGIDWLESLRRENCKSHRLMADRGMTRFYYPGFDGYDQTGGEIAHNTVAGSFAELKSLCESHGWLENMTAEQLDKLYEVNAQGWPIEHIASMIWMCEPIKTDYPWPGFGMEQKEILAVLTQHRDLQQYENMCSKRRLAMETEKTKEVENDIKPGKMWQKQEVGSRRR